MSLNTIGEKLIECLQSGPWTLLVKLHPMSCHTYAIPPGYSRTDWPQFLDKKARSGRLIHVTDQITARYLRAGDVLITDHGSTLYEYMVLGRPILYYDTPEAQAVMTMPETLTVIRQAVHTFQQPDQALQILTKGDLAKLAKWVLRNNSSCATGFTTWATQPKEQQRQSIDCSGSSRNRHRHHLSLAPGGRSQSHSTDIVRRFLRVNGSQQSGRSRRGKLQGKPTPLPRLVLKHRRNFANPRKNVHPNQAKHGR